MDMRGGKRLFPISIAKLLMIGAVAVGLAFSGPSGLAPGLVSKDLYRFRSVGQVALSPDDHQVAYTVTMNDRPGRPYSQTWIMDIATAASIRLGGEKEASSNPLWSPDGRWLCYTAGEGDKAGLYVAHADGSGASFLAPVRGSNSPLPGQGESVTWSPDSRQIAYVSSTPGPETSEASGDPVVITRYLYRPTATEGFSHFNDNRRLHIFTVDVASHQVRQLTQGTNDEHSIDWSPDGKEILFVSNHEPNSDEFFNYDIFAVKVADGAVRRLTATESNEYAPRWSPDGKTIVYSSNRRGLTDRETNMEDSHVWLMDADGSHRHEVSGMIDDRQGQPLWSPEGDAVYFTVLERGSIHLVRLPISTSGSAGQPEIISNDPGAITSLSIGHKGLTAYALSTPQDMVELYLKTGSGPPRRLTDLNADVLRGKTLGPVESFTFISNDNKFEVEAFLTKPVDLKEDSQDMAAAPKHPLIVNLHGGPHGQSGPAFTFKNQLYAAHGWATLQVNYRGSTGYGQKFADAVFGDQNGNEAQDVLYGVSAAVRRYLWLDRERMGVEGVSYGGQLSDWLITQTNEFKAAIPIAGISNLISYNYMTYYNQYEEMEFGQFLHQGNWMDFAWQRSAIKYVANVHTPTLLIHGENDPDVPIAEAEQYFVALKDVGVDTVFVRYPREGHGLVETQHQVDSTDRCIAWYEKHFPPPGAHGVTNVQP
jgi:dipeptidyl aminopeptidase/acylaminoacyl peptidase